MEMSLTEGKSEQAQNKLYKCSIAQIGESMKGNFKVRCVNIERNHFYTVGKTYEFKDGFMVNDLGEKFPYKGMDSFEEWQDFSGSKWELVTNIKEVTIRQKGRKVIAVMTDDGKYIKSAKAKCNPTDEFDFEVGAKLAFDRLMGRVGQLDLKTTNPSFDWEGFKQGKFAVHCDTEDKAKAFLKECDEQGIRWCTGARPMAEQKETRWEFYRENTSYGCDCQKDLQYGTYDRKPKVEYRLNPAVREVKRPAKVGEWIKTLASVHRQNNYVVDGIYRVVRVNYEGYPVINGGDSYDDVWDVVTDAYVVLENYQPEETDKTLADYTDKELIDELAKRLEDKQ